MNDLIHSDELTTSFLELLSKTPVSIDGKALATRRKGPMLLSDLGPDLQKNVKVSINNSAISLHSFAELYDGCIDRYEGDHSSADFAFIRILADKGFSPDECDQVLRTSGLYRDKWDRKWGNSTYGWNTINRVFATLQGGAEDSDKFQDLPAIKSESATNALRLTDFVPKYIPGGMPPREFAGPKIAPGAHLFPKNALSAMVALGGVGKTTSLISLGAHMAAGRHWKGCPVKATKVIVFCVEETQDELTRKFSAIVDQWAEPDREQAIANLRLISLHGLDARLIQNDYSGVMATVWPQRIADLAIEFGMDGNGVIFLDHYQGFANGDLNTSDTATAMCREGNSIVSRTGAAVVYTAHIPKGQINNLQVAQGMASGSLAFENAMRQVVVLLPMSDDEAKKYGREDDRRDFVRLGFAKNSYGASDAECWLRKVHVPDYHTIRIEPVELLVPVPQARRSANDKLTDAIMRFIEGRPYVTKNMIDSASGADGPLGASKDKCRGVLSGLIDDGTVHSHTVSEDERRKFGIPKQVKEVLRVS